MEKELILLVGPQGSGKSTIAQEEFKDYFRISQDDQGKKGHFELFLQALQNNTQKILIDRMNHVEYQRKKYISLAQKHGYHTKIIILNLDFKSCYERILNRGNHPYLHSESQEKDVLKALRIYFREYEIPLTSEADEVDFRSEYDPFCLDLSQKYSKFLVIGDIHGCCDELLELLEKSFQVKGVKKIKEKIISENIAVVFLGDLVDKGPKIKEVMELFESLPHAYSIMGNHEYKLLRHLRGNNVVISHGLENSIEQLELGSDLLFTLESFPFMIKLTPQDYCVHGGINPIKHLFRQTREALLYTRTFNPVTFDFKNSEDPYWFKEYNEERERIYFGHHYHESIEVSKNVFALDGYCVYGKELRGMMMEFENDSLVSKEIITIKAHKIHREKNGDKPPKSDSLKPFEEEVEKGYLNKSLFGNLVLYNYSNKCVYDKRWNDVTLKSRGIIFDKRYGTLIANPFSKFFNIGENDQSRLENLPLHLEYEVFDKVDGSLGILYFYEDNWRISTRGEINSEQALKAMQILNEKYETDPLDKKYTYMVEIIYPENKIIVDYGDEEKLVLLAGIETSNSKELTYNELLELAKKSGFELIKKFNHTIEEVLAMKETLSKDKEGFVIRFSTGLRVKVKGNEYLALAKIISHLSPLSLWEVMKEGKVSKEYLASLPEELLPQIQGAIAKLEEKYSNLVLEINSDIAKLPSVNQKEVSKFISKNEFSLFHHKIIFPALLKKSKKVEEYIMKRIRPKNNELE